MLLQLESMLPPLPRLLLTLPPPQLLYLLLPELLPLPTPEFPLLLMPEHLLWPMVLRQYLPLLLVKLPSPLSSLTPDTLFPTESTKPFSNPSSSYWPRNLQPSTHTLAIFHLSEYFTKAVTTLPLPATALTHFHFSILHLHSYFLVLDVLTQFWHVFKKIVQIYNIEIVLYFFKEFFVQHREIKQAICSFSCHYENTETVELLVLTPSKSPVLISGPLVSRAIAREGSTPCFSCKTPNQFKNIFDDN